MIKNSVNPTNISGFDIFIQYLKIVKNYKLKILDKF